MNTPEKKRYSTPNLEQIVLDNEISLVLESSPPSGPFETNRLSTPQYFSENPFKKELA